MNRVLIVKKRMLTWSRERFSMAFPLQCSPSKSLVYSSQLTGFSIRSQLRRRVRILFASNMTIPVGHLKAIAAVTCTHVNGKHLEIQHSTKDFTKLVFKHIKCAKSKTNVCVVSRVLVWRETEGGGDRVRKDPKPANRTLVSCNFWEFGPWSVLVKSLDDSTVTMVGHFTPIF